MTDFTAWSHPVLAVVCPRAADFHARRKAEADRHFIDRHGADASIERTGDGGRRIDPQGRFRKDEVS